MQSKKEDGATNRMNELTVVPEVKNRSRPPIWRLPEMLGAADIGFGGYAVTE